MAGRGSLAGLLSYGDANAIVQEMGCEVLPIVKKTPVLAGVCGTDPFRVMDLFLKQLKDQGFNGVQKPTWKKPAWVTAWKWKWSGKPINLIC